MNENTMFKEDLRHGESVDVGRYGYNNPQRRHKLRSNWPNQATAVEMEKKEYVCREHTKDLPEIVN